MAVKYTTVKQKLLKKHYSEYWKFLCNVYFFSVLSHYNDTYWVRKNWIKLRTAKQMNKNLPHILAFDWGQHLFILQKSEVRMWWFQGEVMVLIYVYDKVWTLSAYKTKHEHVDWKRSAISALPGLSEETERHNGMNIMYILLVFHVCHLEESLVV